MSDYPLSASVYSNMTRQRQVSWREVEEAVRAIAAQISRDRIREIIGIARGGLVPAVMLAYEMRITAVRAIGAHEVLIMQDAVLLVDDIADTGCTLQHISGSAITSVLFAKPLGRAWCRYWGAEAPQDEWLVFPWAPADVINR